ncbi:TPA: Crp/Fnr family transcriptional regulator [Elizabethkingia anophelis]
MNFGDKILHSRNAIIKKYRPSEFIFKEGDMPHFYYRILNGRIKFNNYSEDGKEVIQNFFEKGTSFGDSFLLAQLPYPVNAEVLEDSEILRLPESEYINILQEEPELSMERNKDFAERLYFKSVMEQQIGSSKASAKLKGLMDYYKSFEKNKKPYSFPIPLTRQQMANFTGLCVETVIRTIKKMEIDKLLKIHNSKIMYLFMIEVIFSGS